MPFCLGKTEIRSLWIPALDGSGIMGRFYENRTYTFVFDARLTNGEAEVLLLDKKKQTVLKLSRQFPSQTIALDARKSRYYLCWEFQSASGTCELRW